MKNASRETETCSKYSFLCAAVVRTPWNRLGFERIRKLCENREKLSSFSEGFELSSGTESFVAVNREFSQQNKKKVLINIYDENSLKRFEIARVW